jgi:hypothetical protein
MGHSPYRKWSQYRARYTVIATDRTDPGSFLLGDRLAQRVAARRPELRATAARSQDARTLLSLLRTRQLELALLRAEDAFQAAEGTGAYATLATPLRVLAALAPEYLHIVVGAASAVRAVGDLKGQRVGVVDGAGRARLKAQRIVAAYGLDPEADVAWQSVAPGQGLSALGGGLVVAYCLEAPAPAAELGPGQRPAGVRLRLVEHGDALPALVARYGPVYFPAPLGAERYPNVEAGVEVLAEARLLVCREEYPPERARAVVEALAGWEELAPTGTPLPVPAHRALPAG